MIGFRGWRRSREQRQVGVQGAHIRAAGAGQGAAGRGQAQSRRVAAPAGPGGRVRPAGRRRPQGRGRLLGPPLRPQARRSGRAADVRAAAVADPARGPRSRGRRWNCRLDLTGARAAESKATRTSAPYKKGDYPAVVDTFYDDPWLEGHARFVDGADVHFSVIDHVRASRKTKRSASGKTKQKTKRKRKIEFSVTVSLPTRNYAATSAPPARDGRGHPQGVGRDGIRPHGREAQPHGHPAVRRHAAGHRAAAGADRRGLRARRSHAEEEAVSLDQCACKRGFFTLRDCAQRRHDELLDLHAAGVRRTRDARASASSAPPSARRRSPSVRPAPPCVERTRWYDSTDYSPMWWATSRPLLEPVGLPLVRRRRRGGR